MQVYNEKAAAIRGGRRWTPLSIGRHEIGTYVRHSAVLLEIEQAAIFPLSLSPICKNSCV